MALSFAEYELSIFDYKFWHLSLIFPEKSLCTDGDWAGRNRDWSGTVEISRDRNTPHWSHAQNFMSAACSEFTVFGSELHTINHAKCPCDISISQLKGINKYNSNTRPVMPMNEWAVSSSLSYIRITPARIKCWLPEIHYSIAAFYIYTCNT